MISGITEELIKLAVKYGFSDMPEEWKYGDNTKETKKRYVTHYSPTIFAMALDEYLAENGVTIVLDCLATNPANITIYLLQEE